MCASWHLTFFCTLFTCGIQAALLTFLVPTGDLKGIRLPGLSFAIYVGSSLS